MDGGQLALDHWAQLIAQFVDPAHADLGHFQLDTMAGQLGERSRRASERDVQEFDESILLENRELFHADPSLSATSSAFRMSFLS